MHADGRHFVINVVREGLVFAAAVNGEGRSGGALFSPLASAPGPLPSHTHTSTIEPPLFVTEFLHRMVDVFEEYFDKKISEKILRKEAVLIYQVGASMVF